MKKLNKKDLNAVTGGASAGATLLITLNTKQRQKIPIPADTNVV